MPTVTGNKDVRHVQAVLSCLQSYLIKQLPSHLPSQLPTVTGNKDVRHVQGCAELPSELTYQAAAARVCLAGCMQTRTCYKDLRRFCLQLRLAGRNELPSDASLVPAAQHYYTDRHAGTLPLIAQASSSCRHDAQTMLDTMAEPDQAVHGVSATAVITV